jgi:hypothetical protein
MKVSLADKPQSTKIDVDPEETTVELALLPLANIENFTLSLPIDLLKC